MIPTKHLPRLYHTNAKGTVYEWEVFTRGADIITLYGQVGGESQQAVKTAVGKNIGRSNETTPEAQALIEAQAMWTKKKDRKYTETIGEKHTFEAPMLADSYDKFKGRIEYPCFVQPKLDGMRALLMHNGDTFELWSRGGKLITTCSHLIDAANEHLQPNRLYDGELYAHGLTFEENTRLVKKQRPETTSVLFHVFDIADTDTTFNERYGAMNVGMTRLYTCPLFVNVETAFAHTEEEVDHLHSYFIQQGYEGSIIRNSEGAYIFGKRSKDVLKRKDFLDAEYLITGFRNGIGKFEYCPIFTCVTPEGESFEVAPRGSAEVRARMLEDAPSYVGQMLNVRYQNLTENGIPRFPVGTAVREAWDLS